MTADAETRRIYGEGCLASHQGKPRSDCPYPEGSVDRAAWTTGWDEASEDDLREGGTCEECFESAAVLALLLFRGERPKGSNGSGA